ncbi:LacI family DNA-binding transcriptional regulator [Vallicoccus soli]|uniref:LacI family transcriptional regulator n=1 Tax=Vallicoccus soli TaxID=2339232 RepID=A0A3A3YXL0_9ACTN|nr:LacI family DNA-binding transcriptional regulator [Vallicoccus soli]RJK96388.1 LacI family transcriptional regulator [Vallicoccus soli]
MATIQDVARRAGVSAATVSRALNSVGRVDPELVRRARQAAEELGYRPNAVARNLRRQRTAIWVLVISDVENPFFTRMARGVEDVAAAAGYSLVLCNTDEDLVKEQRYIGVADQEQAAGVIISPTSHATDVSRIRDRGIPVVAVDRTMDGQLDSVVVDSRSSAREATEHLLAQGWRRVACITGPKGAATADERLRGYCDALPPTRGGGRPRGVVRHSTFKAEGGRAAAASLLDAAAPPDAIFVANNQMAVGVLAELRARGVRPGRDLGVVAFDDPPWAELVDPPLTGIAQPSYEIGAAAARVLRDRLAGTLGGPAREEVLPARLVVRESSLRRPA